MPSATLNTDAAIAGIAFSTTISRSAEGSIAHEVTAAAGIAGTLSTRTDDNTGIVTMASGHGVTDANTVDLYWTGGVRYGMTVTAYDATTVTVDLGAGDNLPVVDTTLVLGVQMSVDTDVDGDLFSIIAATAAARAHLEFRTSGASLASVEIAASEIFSWDSASGTANPFTGDPIDAIRVSSGTAVETAIRVGILYYSA